MFTDEFGRTIILLGVGAVISLLSGWVGGWLTDKRAEKREILKDKQARKDAQRALARDNANVALDHMNVLVEAIAGQRPSPENGFSYQLSNEDFKAAAKAIMLVPDDELRKAFDYGQRLLNSSDAMLLYGDGELPEVHQRMTIHTLRDLVASYLRGNDITDADIAEIVETSLEHKKATKAYWEDRP